MEIKLNGEQFIVKNDEFPIISHPEYNTLILRPTLGIFERELGLIKQLKHIDNTLEFINIGLSHGGYLPLKLVEVFESIKIITNDPQQVENFNLNKKIHDLLGVVTVHDTFVREPIVKRIIRLDGDTNAPPLNQDVDLFILAQFPMTLAGFVSYTMRNCDLHLLVSSEINSRFRHVFRYYLNGDDNVLEYDNLINLCIMVKDAGSTFQRVLEQNLPFIDRWTILDTGSTDSTIETIKTVLDCKKGKLYQEPFINFRDSRNRCLELAGTSCKYNIMLDDTYILTGEVREFLSFIRSDQYADSYNIFVQSGDMIYGSNRIVKSQLGLRYVHKIHEIINPVGNVVVQLPIEKMYIRDLQTDYMSQRSIARKQSDLKLLQTEIEQEPENPRHLYYMAQTYIELKMWKKACDYFNRRTIHPKEGYREEITDAYFQQAYLKENQLNCEWKECERLYLECHNFDKNLPDPLFCIGYHYYLNGDTRIAYDYFKRGFQLGFPATTSNLRPNIYKIYLPQFLTGLCYQYNDYHLGELAAQRYLEHNPPNETIVSYLKIFRLFKKSVLYDRKEVPCQKILCFVADGGFKPWEGSSIDREGMGGSETYIIELSRAIASQSGLKVYVFCDCVAEEEYCGVSYRRIAEYIPFIDKYWVDYSVISRYSEYIPVTLKKVPNVFLVVHDLLPSGNIIPVHENLRAIFCLTEWHREHFLNVYPVFKDRVHVFPNGINIKEHRLLEKKSHSFIYSSFPNRGLVHLLRMFPKIRERFPNATLEVFCDTHGEFVQQVAKKEMGEVDRLLREHSAYVTNHGWVPKGVLNKYWATSQVWLYPCTFMETFCITALEAAASRTLAVTTDLAGLKNTVGDRGLVISGDPSTDEWWDRAINQLVKTLGDEHILNELLTRNKVWADEHDWAKLAGKFMSNFLTSTTTIREELLDYAGMLNWTVDIPTSTKVTFEKILDRFKGKQCKILEIGTYAGTSVIGMLRRLPDSRATVIDIWENYDEADLTRTITERNIEKIFYKNLQIAGVTNRVNVIKERSIDAMTGVLEGEEYDFIYVDGSHKYIDCYNDICASWRLLKNGGVLAIDDYLWVPSADQVATDSPFYAIERFMFEYKIEYTLLDKGWRVFLLKLLL